MPRWVTPVRAVLTLQLVHGLNLACYPLDVIKSRNQLRSTPPTGTLVQYITRASSTITHLIVADSDTQALQTGTSLILK
ncbi:hypothetical protein B0H11DRAFT_2240951 [Mycena galericulata]|nr:hypothetical protein B0H11DRAFT_2240951 [Mycena galericulata]